MGAMGGAMGAGMGSGLVSSGMGGAGRGGVPGGFPSGGGGPGVAGFVWPPGHTPPQAVGPTATAAGAAVATVVAQPITETRLVWTDEDVSIEERRASLPKYSGSARV